MGLGIFEKIFSSREKVIFVEKIEELLIFWWKINFDLHARQ